MRPPNKYRARRALMRGRRMILRRHVRLDRWLRDARGHLLHGLTARALVVSVKVYRLGKLGYQARAQGAAIVWTGS